jgi:hypothetical protein
MIRFVGTLTLKFTVPGNSAATNRFQIAKDTDADSASSAIVAKYERDFLGLTWEGNAALDQEIYSLFAAGQIRQAFAQSLSGKVKWSRNLWGDHAQFEGEMDIAGDEFGCIFGTTGKIIGTLKRPNQLYSLFIPPLPPSTEIVVEYAGSMRWNLTPKAWMNLAKRVGVMKFLRILKLCGSWGKTIIRILASEGILAEISLVAAGPMAVGATAGLIGFGLGMTMIAAHASYGRRLGILTTYCRGYVVRVFEERTKIKGHFTGKRSANRNTDNASGFYMSGYDDAGRAIRAASLEEVEGILIRRFGTQFTYSLDRNASYFVKKNRHLTYGSTIDDEFSEARKIADAWGAEIAGNFDEYQEFVNQYAGDVSQAGW